MESHVTLDTVDGVVAQITRLHRSLPLRPDIDEVEAAKALVQNVDKDDGSIIEAVAKQRKSPDVPQELFKILVEMQMNLITYHGKEKKKEALKVLELENLHLQYDDLIQRASTCVQSSTPSSKMPSSNSNHHPDHSNGSASTLSSSNFSPSRSSAASSGPSTASVRTHSSTFYFTGKEPIKSSGVFSKDDSYVQTTSSLFFSDKTGAASTKGPPKLHQIQDSSLNPDKDNGQDSDKLSFIKLASLIETSSKKGSRELNLQNKLSNGVSQLPESVAKLSGLMTLDLSKNQLAVLPSTIGGLSCLTKLDLHDNRIEEVPDDFCNLVNLVFLDLSSNQFTSLPGAFGKLVHLEELHLSSNRLVALPESVGSLIRLKGLMVETNDIEEIPHSIGHCASLRELRADYNRLKALPEALGRIGTLQVLSVRYNNIKQLPTTMSSLVKLQELDVSFNELESIPESLCFATSLVKMNVGGNFADLQSLPRSIGNLEMLEELDISNNQIRFLPESFRLLARLRILRADENPLEVPPRHIVDNGAQAVVSYMAEPASNRDTKFQPSKRYKGWVRIPGLFQMNLKKRNASDYVKAQY
uniref:Disease resistance R13L4/SHOC-2-like LRR domain-containing protein n=1 Tax=Kalanchoe fedtschenkoi TaxID=63787 RepID=A0A7N0UGX0_KALFE